MRFISYDQGRIGVLADADTFVDISELAGATAAAWPPVNMVRLIGSYRTLRSAVEARLATAARRRLAEVNLECPLSWPNKVIAFPANYHDHISEMKAGLVSKFTASGQGFFLKANSSLSGPRQAILLPDVPNREIHHEAELAIIIGSRGRGIRRQDAFEHIFGYSCLLDIVIRGQEERVMRKSFDTFCPLGPWITTGDEVQDPSQLNVRLTVNGQLRQSANTRDLIVDIPSMIEMASSVMTLEPGDVIATGTPAGVAKIVHGDRLVIAIDSVGSMDVGVQSSALGSHPVWDKPPAGAR